MEGLIHAGTGKTVIAAFDYRNFRKNIPERLADFYSYSPRRNPAPKPGYFPGCTARLMGVSFAELSAVQLRMTQTASSETMKDSAETSAFESFTAIDNDACSVAIRSIDPNSSWGYEIQVALENKSPDKTYMFAMETATVNGVETEICNLSWSGTTLEENGITEVTDLEFTLRAYDEDDWSGNAYQSLVRARTVYLGYCRSGGSICKNVSLGDLSADD